MASGRGNYELNTKNTGSSKRGRGDYSFTSNSSSSNNNVQKRIKNYKTRLKNIGKDTDITDKRNWLEKTLNLKQDQNVLFDVFELLGRPQQALFGAIDAGQKGKNVLKGAKKGISGEKEYTGGQLLRNAGMSGNGKFNLFDKKSYKNASASDFLGFAADILLDPVDLALIGVTAATGGAAAPATVPTIAGTAAKGAEVASKGAKVVKTANTISDASKAIKAANAVKKAGNVYDVVRTADKASDTIRAVRKADNAIKAIDTATDVAQTAKKANAFQRILTKGAKPTNLKIGGKQISRTSLSQILMNTLGEGVKGTGKLADLGIEKRLTKLDSSTARKIEKLVDKGLDKSEAIKKVGKAADKLDTYKALKEGIKRTFDSSKNLGGFLGRSRDIENLADFNKATGEITKEAFENEIRTLAKGDDTAYKKIAENLNTLVESKRDWTIKGEEILNNLKPNKKIDLFNEDNANTVVNYLRGYGINAEVKDGRFVKVKSAAGDTKLNLLKSDEALRKEFSNLNLGERLSKEDYADIANAENFFNSNPEYKAFYDRLFPQANAKETRRLSPIEQIARNSDELTGLNASNIADESYVPHVLTDKAKEKLGKKVTGGNNQFNARKYQMTTNEANRYKKAELKAKKASMQEAIEKKSKDWFDVDLKGNIKLDSNGNPIRNETAYKDIVSRKQKEIDNLKAQKDNIDEMLNFKQGKEYDISKLSKKDKAIIELANKQESLRSSIKSLKNINYADIDNVDAIRGANKALTNYNRAQKKLQTAIKNGITGDKLSKMKDAVDTASKEVRLEVQSLEKFANKKARNAVKDANKAFKEGSDLGTQIQKQTDIFYRNGETINAAFDAAGDMSDSIINKIKLKEAELRKTINAKDAMFAKKYEEIGKLKEAANIITDPDNFEFFSNNFMDNIGSYVERNAAFSKGAQLYNEALTRGIFDNPEYIKMTSDLKDGKIPHNFVKVNGSKLKNKLDRFNGILPENSKALTDVLERFSGKDIYMDKDLATIFRVAPPTSELHPLLKMMDGINNVFKKFSTLSLGFQTRNIIGNSTNMVLSGMPAGRLPEYYTKAHSLWNRADDLYKKFSTQGMDALTAAEKADLNILRQFKEAGFTDAAIKGQGLEEIAKVKKGPLNKISQKSVELNNKMDSFNRLTLLMYANDNPKYVQKLGKKNAVEAVRYALFDPNNMSSFEKNVMKRAMPFYTFTKQNLLYQADNIMRNTPRYHKLFKGLDKLYKGVGESSYAEYQKNNMQIPLPFTDKNGNTLFLKANLPISDLGEFLTNPLQRTLSSTTPILKTPIEMVTGKDLFTGQDTYKNTFNDLRQSATGKEFGEGGKKWATRAEQVLSGMGLSNVSTNLVKKVSAVLKNHNGDMDNQAMWAEIFRSVLQNTNQSKIEKAKAYQEMLDYQEYVKGLKNQGTEVPTIRDITAHNKTSLTRAKRRRSNRGNYSFN